MSSIITELTPAHEAPFWASVSADLLGQQLHTGDVRVQQEDIDRMLAKGLIQQGFRQELYNYVVRGFKPGAFDYATYANDMQTACLASHPQNVWSDIRATAKWLAFSAPANCHGSYERVEAWLALAPSDRYAMCVDRGLLLTDKEVEWNALKGEYA